MHWEGAEKRERAVGNEGTAEAERASYPPDSLIFTP